MKAVRAGLLALLTFASCTQARVSHDTNPAVGPTTLARVYYWRAKPGKLADYNRYVREIAEPIDMEAQRRGAFISVITYVARDTLSPWTHMRVFLLRDSTQLAALADALARAGERLEPDSARRRVRGEYAATLRDRVGDSTLEILR
ncbi:MAG TPA: hypothetical protein VGQ52_11000 [Gemmatimonadaceae bacterium]|jgi:hypothetical protein|nr:hypothetical protein [Gemmatimonadaceae bacterium]